MSSAYRISLHEWQMSAWLAGRLAVLHVPIEGEVRVVDGRAYLTDEPEKIKPKQPPVFPGGLMQIGPKGGLRVVEVRVANIVALPGLDAIRPTTTLAAGAAELRAALRLNPAIPADNIYRTVLALPENGGARPRWEITLVTAHPTDEPRAA